MPGGFPAGNGGVTYPSPNEWPITVFAITGITKSVNAKVTAPSHGITLSSNASVPRVDFTQVKGMKEINGQFGYVLQVVDADNIVVQVNTQFFSPYLSGGFINITGGSSPDDPLTNLFP